MSKKWSKKNPRNAQKNAPKNVPKNIPKTFRKNAPFNVTLLDVTPVFHFLTVLFPKTNNNSGDQKNIFQSETQKEFCLLTKRHWNVLLQVLQTTLVIY